VITSIAGSVPEFCQALKAGESRFGYLNRERNSGQNRYLGAEIAHFSFQDALQRWPLESLHARRCRQLRKPAYTCQVALLAMMEAWSDAGLNGEQTERSCSVVVAGSNLQQREIQQTQMKYRDRVEYMRPIYGLTFFDTDVVGCLSEVFGITGEGYTIGGASASGNLGIIHGVRHILHGEADIVAVVGGLMDLSEFELQGLMSLGAMGGIRFHDRPEAACRPFDRDREGFIYGEGCGCIILEKRQQAEARKAKIRGSIAGYGISMDGTRNPNPSLDGEKVVMNRAMKMAGVRPEQIDYINTHGSGSIIGDEIELEALRQTGLNTARVNATKSLTGHLLSAAGVVECIATFVQMQHGFFHPTRNLDHPIASDVNWVSADSEEGVIRCAISNSFGFGGINTAIVMRSE
jgi:malonyl-ACP decarboxylase